MPQNNAPPGTVIPTAGGVSPGGIQGPAGPSSTATLNGISPTTTKGDLIVDDGGGGGGASDTRLAIGTDGQVLHTRSSQALGQQWSGIDMTGALTTLLNTLPVTKGGTGAATRTLGFNALAPAGPTAGAALVFDGTNWVLLPIGAALQQLRVNAVATALEWAAGSNSVIQMVSASSATYSSITGVTPYDDTVPQIGEGTQLVSLSITPSSNTTRLLIQAEITGVASVPDAYIAAIHNGAASAIAADWVVVQTASVGVVIPLSVVVVPGATTPLTITLRIGSASGSAFELNGQGGVRKLGGVSKAWLRATEYA